MPWTQHVAETEIIELGPATEDDMVVAFLRGEMNSSRRITIALRQQGLTRRLIDEPNSANAEENNVRKQLLAFRGYEQREALFTGFPLDASWRRVVLEAHDLQLLRYANYHTWGGSVRWHAPRVCWRNAISANDPDTHPRSMA
jgi:hypothetical protein